MKTFQLRKWAVMVLFTALSFQLSAQNPTLGDSTVVVERKIEVVNGDTIITEERTVEYQPLIESWGNFAKIYNEIYYSFGGTEKTMKRNLKKTFRTLGKTVKTLNKYSQTNIAGNSQQIKQLLGELNLRIGGREYKNYELSDEFTAAFTQENIKQTIDFLNLTKKSLDRALKQGNALSAHEYVFTTYEENIKQLISERKEPKKIELLNAFGHEYITWISAYMSAYSPLRGSKGSVSGYSPSYLQEQERKETERKERDRKIFDNAYTLSPNQVKVSEIPYRGGNDCRLVSIEPLADVTKVTTAIPIHFESNWFSTSSDYIEDAATGDRYYSRSIERDIPLDRIIIIKDNARTMTEITTLYPPLKEGVKFIRIKSLDESNVDLPSNAAEDTDYGLIFIDDYNPALKDTKKEIKEYR